MAELAYLQVARVCNQKCRFCSNPENGKIMDWDMAAAMVDAFAGEGAQGVILTGGEPTLFPRLPELITRALEKNLPPRLITNGQKCADRKYFRTLVDAGLRHMHVSVHSTIEETQAELTGSVRSLANIYRALENAGRAGVRVDINTVINAENAGHLSRTVVALVERFTFLKHFVWNNLDPLMNRASQELGLVPRLRAFEAELDAAMRFLNDGGRTFRVERVPLCFMSGFPHRSTETRKIVKGENRDIYFLDEKGLCRQDQAAWSYGKSQRCSACPASSVCAGLYQMGVYYQAEELCPLFMEPAVVAAAVHGDCA